MIEEVGILKEIQRQRGNLILKISAAEALEGMAVGDSVAVSGPCLTVTETGSNWFSVEASAHTSKNSTINQWQVGRRVHLERALKVGDRLGGHIVQGHIDGIGRINLIRNEAGSKWIYLEIAHQLQKLMVSRGSITIDGVSLTIAEKTGNMITVMVIPHTLTHTTLGDLKPGVTVNLETDLIIRWLAERFPDNSESIPSVTSFANFDNTHLED